MRDHLPSEARVSGYLDGLAGMQFNTQDPPYQDDALNKAYLVGMNGASEALSIAKALGTSVEELTRAATKLAIARIEGLLSGWACGFEGLPESELNNQAYREAAGRRWRTRH